MKTTTLSAAPGTPNPPTPETTPVPGGGSWHWDAATAAWLPNPAPGDEAPATTPTTQPDTQPA